MFSWSPLEHPFSIFEFISVWGEKGGHSWKAFTKKDTYFLFCFVCILLSTLQTLGGSKYLRPALVDKGVSPWKKGCVGVFFSCSLCISRKWRGAVPGRIQGLCHCCQSSGLTHIHKAGTVPKDSCPFRETPCGQGEKCKWCEGEIETHLTLPRNSLLPARSLTEFLSRPQSPWRTSCLPLYPLCPGHTAYVSIQWENKWMDPQAEGWMDEEIWWCSDSWAVHRPNWVSFNL
jgi:hypothetical protein